MKIFQIEITNKCNLNCSYCPRRYMMRDEGVISYEILKLVVDKIENNILRLHHYGESLLDEDIVNKIKFIKKRKPKLILILNTNGILLTPEKTKELFEAGLNQIVISYHNEASIKYIKEIESIYREKIEVIKILNKKEDLNNIKKLGYKTNTKKLRNLGQIKKEKILKTKAEDRCSFLKNNEVAILWDGTIVPCCECFDNIYILGNIKEDNIVKNKKFTLCRSCLGYGNNEEETERW